MWLNVEKNINILLLLESVLSYIFIRNTCIFLFIAVNCIDILRYIIL